MTIDPLDHILSDILTKLDLTDGYLDAEDETRERTIHVTDHLTVSAWRRMERNQHDELDVAYTLSDGDVRLVVTDTEEAVQLALAILHLARWEHAGAWVSVPGALVGLTSVHPTIDGDAA